MPALNPGRAVIAHGHIFKNAGTTFDWALERNFGERFLDHRDDQPMRKEGAPYLKRLLQSRPEILAISSHHLCSPLPDLPHARMIPVYLLRHPVERVLSVYEFERRQMAATPGAIRAKAAGIAEYVRWRLLPESGATIRNYHVRYLAGMHTAGRKPVDRSAYERALENLHNAEVGLVERFDESMVVLERRLRRYFPDLDLAYVTQNVTRDVETSQQQKLQELEERLGSSLFDEVVEANQYDLELYRAGRTLLDERRRGVRDFQQALDDFVARCGKLQ